jgi:serine protease Do
MGWNYMQSARLLVVIVLGCLTAAGCSRRDSTPGPKPKTLAAHQWVAPDQSSETSKAADGSWTAVGLQVRDVPVAALRALGVSYGVMVTRVRSPADRSRILPGDVIVGVNQSPVRNLEDFNRLVSEPVAGALGLLVRRVDADLYISLEQGLGSASRGGGTPPLPEESFKRRSPTGTPLRT